METNRKDVEEWFNMQVGRKKKSKSADFMFPGSLLTSHKLLQNSMSLDCVSDGRAEAADSHQLSRAAELPKGDHGTETHQKCSGD